MIGPQKTEPGFSLIEVVIALAILGILTAFAIVAIGSSAKDLQRQNIATQFKNSLERARFDSVRRRANECDSMSRVEITSGTSFTLLTDANQNGELEPDLETRTFDFGSRTDVVIVNGDLVFYPIVIRFNHRGHSSSGVCGDETAAHTPTVFCTKPCTFATADQSNSNLVFISRTGTPTLLHGGSALAAIGSPTIQSIDNSNQINPLLAVWDIAPVVSPTATPTPTPTPSPTVTPTPTPNPAPTATPTRWCLLGE
ncbi:MAG TPA: type II secretion system protein, partial [Pyrinomonadaceae bacterium]|nr:type II secretion system protein [Pyrinomonadaceae bacterium]